MGRGLVGLGRRVDFTCLSSLFGLHAKWSALEHVVLHHIFWILVPIGLYEYLALRPASEPPDDDQLRTVNLKP